MKDYYCKSKDILITKTEFSCCSGCNQCKTLLYCNQRYGNNSMDMIDIIMSQLVIEYEQRLREKKLEQLQLAHKQKLREEKLKRILS
jgi:hypothetical protein